MDPVTDLSDTRVLIPRLRRALDGPTATSSASVSSTLSDEQLNNIGADAIAAMIFYTGSLLGCELEVAQRDPVYQAPIAWRTSPALTEVQVTAVVAQAALDYFYNRLTTGDTAKVAEEIADEATKWNWEISPQAVVERLRQLRADRDGAISQLEEEGNAMDADYVSFIANRDSWTSRLIEPWVEEGIQHGGLSPIEFW